MLKRYKIIKRESKYGVNFKIKPENNQHPFGFEELGGAIVSIDPIHATAFLKQLIKDALVKGGFGWS